MKKIAVVEDNADNRLLVQAILGEYYAVTEYETGIKALRCLHEEKPDLILLDISLPEMDGIEVLRRIRSDDVLRDIPVIALTAHAMAGDREKYIGAGFNDYISKPIEDEGILLGAIERLLNVGEGLRGREEGRRDVTPSRSAERDGINPSPTRF